MAEKFEGPPSQWLVYGVTGTEKSRFAATFPKPMVVLMFDPFAKSLPYLRRGNAPGLEFNDKHGFQQQSVIRKSEPYDEVIRIEYYNDMRAKSKGLYGYEMLVNRMPSLFDEVFAGEWKTVVVDSLTSLEFAIRTLNKEKLNPKAASGAVQDARQWYNASSDGVENLCCSQLAWMPCNVVVLAHVRLEKENDVGQMHWLPAAPGRKSLTLPGWFAECYAIKKDNGVSTLQTERDASWIATTQIPVSDGTLAHYDNLWDVYKEQQGIVEPAMEGEVQDG